MTKLSSRSHFDSLLQKLALNSHLSYGLVLWGNTNKSDIDKIKHLRERAIYAISESSNDTSINRLFNLKILNIDDLSKLQLSSLMWDYDHDITSSLKDLFKRSNIVDKHGTCGATRGNLYHTKVNTVLVELQEEIYIIPK